MRNFIETLITYIINLIATIPMEIIDTIPYFITLCFLIVLTYPYNTMAHELGHYITLKHYLKKYDKTQYYKLKSYIYVLPKMFSGGNSCINIETKENFTDWLKENKKYKELIWIYRSGILTQIIFAIIFYILFVLFHNYIPILYSLTFNTIHLICTVFTFLFTGGEERDRFQIKKYKNLKRGLKKNKTPT